MTEAKLISLAMAALARRGRGKCSPAKLAAARINGRRGGRPRKDGSRR